MSYAKIISGVVLIYPYDLSQLQADNPNTSFPEELTLPFLATWDIYEVLPQPQPSYNPALQKVVEGVPAFSSPTWLQTWIVVALTVPEQDAYKTTFIDQAKVNTIAYLDAFAATRDYASCDRCCGYKGTSNAQLNADATYMVGGRDSVITSAYATLALIKAGTIPVPTMAGFLATLPALAWPNPETMPAVDGTAVL